VNAIRRFVRWLYGDVDDVDERHDAPVETAVCQVIETSLLREPEAWTVIHDGTQIYNARADYSIWIAGGAKTLGGSVGKAAGPISLPNPVFAEWQERLWEAARPIVERKSLTELEDIVARFERGLLTIEPTDASRDIP
jgi:hypothetical protein